MQSRKLGIFLIISLTFNLAVLAVFLIQWIDSGNGPDPYCDPHQCRAFARSFGLKHSRADSFVLEMSRFRNDEDRLRKSISEERMELMNLFHSAEPDSNKVYQRIDKISRLQGELEKIMVKRLLRVNSVLSDSEKVRFHRILKRRMCRKMHAHPPVIKRGGSCEEI